MLALCEALGNATCVVALPEWQTPDQFADFVEFAWGDPATSELAARRARELPEYRLVAPERTIVQARAPVFARATSAASRAPAPARVFGPRSAARVFRAVRPSRLTREMCRLARGASRPFATR